MSSSSETIPTTPVIIGGRFRDLFCSMRAAREIKEGTGGRIDILSAKLGGLENEDLATLAAAMLRHAEPEITAEQVEAEMGVLETLGVLRAVLAAVGIDLDKLAAAEQELAEAGEETPDPLEATAPGKKPRSRRTSSGSGRTRDKR